jgi:hypothetical protein
MTHARSSDLLGPVRTLFGAGVAAGLLVAELVGARLGRYLRLIGLLAGGTLVLLAVVTSGRG